MRNGDSSKNNNFAKTIPLDQRHLKACIDLDNIALNGLWTQGQWEKELNNKEKLCLGIMKNRDLLAFVCGWLIIDEIHITAIAVHPQYRKKGLAKTLLKTLLAKAKAKGSKLATLEVSSKNSAAKALYKSVGFITKGNRPCYYKNGSDALIQWYSLNKEKNLD